ncbi:hypothetical protein [Paraferrimonas sp. SM1919]|uniref:hypothetical protein n=1 Tax=Paraferrimonas sp. SM1919 TaxID=2662263 RepID=UPI0013D5A9A0|nr:hypothetical protein [Paraferrimonas sp. SM1919]
MTTPTNKDLMQQVTPVNMQKLMQQVDDHLKQAQAQIDQSIKNSFALSAQSKSVLTPPNDTATEQTQTASGVANVAQVVNQTADSASDDAVAQSTATIEHAIAQTTHNMQQAIANTSAGVAGISQQMHQANSATEQSVANMANAAQPDPEPTNPESAS